MSITPRTKHLGNAGCIMKQASGKAARETGATKHRRSKITIVGQRNQVARRTDRNMGVRYDKAETEVMAADGGTKEPIERHAEVNFEVKPQEDLR